jgi:hypothetical protein
MAKYNSIENIPAKLFFDVLHSKDYTLLVAEQENEDLEAIFTSIYDDFFVKSDNTEAKRYLELTFNVNLLSYKIETIKQVMHFLYYNPVTDEMKEKLTTALKTGCGISYDKDANWSEEVLRILQVECGIIENDLTMANLELNKFSGKENKSSFDFFQSIVALSNIHNRNIDETITLAMYVAVENSGKSIIKIQKHNGK